MLQLERPIWALLVTRIAVLLGCSVAPVSAADDLAVLELVATVGRAHASRPAPQSTTSSSPSRTLISSCPELALMLSLAVAADDLVVAAAAFTGAVAGFAAPAGHTRSLVSSRSSMADAVAAGHR